MIGSVYHRAISCCYAVLVLAGLLAGSVGDAAEIGAGGGGRRAN